MSLCCYELDLKKLLYEFKCSAAQKMETSFHQLAFCLPRNKPHVLARISFD